MKILALECSAGPSSCALVENGKILAHEYIHVPLTHSQTLLPMAQRVLRDTSTAVKDIGLFAVSAGPGSFTGVRIGVATIKGLAFGTDLPCAAVSTLAAMAHNVEGLPFDGVICCAMDARCMQVYTACFRCRGGAITRLTEDEAISVEQLKERLSALDEPIILVGDGAELCYKHLQEDLPTIILAAPVVRFQNATGVAAEAGIMAENGQLTTAEALLPIYLRLPQAERELRKRQTEQSS